MSFGWWVVVSVERGVGRVEGEVGGRGVGVVGRERGTMDLKDQEPEGEREAQMKRKMEEKWAAASRKAVRARPSELRR